MTLHTRSGGNWNIVDPFYVRQGGVWVPVQEGFVRQGGTWQLFYSAEDAVFAPTSNELQNIASIFNAAEPGLWNADKNKRLVVNSARGPLTITTGWNGNLTIEVTANGILQGISGLAGTGGAGGQGGAALDIGVGTGIALINNGIIRGGGGGGGRGGTGGSGSYIDYNPNTTGAYTNGSTGSGWKTIYLAQIVSNDPLTYNYFFSQGRIYWGSTLLYSNNSQSGWNAKLATNTHSAGGYVYRRMASAQSLPSPAQGSTGVQGWRIRREQTISTSGGAGGSGGTGQGAGQAATSGASGASGGTNAGAGGTGGAGAVWGTAGSQGGTGSNGNVGNGQAGAAGGAAGRSIVGYNRVNYSGDGTLVGPTQDN